MAYATAIISTLVTGLLFLSIVSNSNPPWSVIKGTLNLLYRNSDVTFAFSTSPSSPASRYVSVALIISLILCAAASLVFWRWAIYGQLSIQDLFSGNMGTALSLIVTILLSVLIALIPSSTERSLKRFEDTWRRELTEFDQVIQEADKILTSSLSGNARLFFASATPIIGLERTPGEWRVWFERLKSHLNTGQARSEEDRPRVVIFDWGRDTQAHESPLWKFCDNFIERGHYRLYDGDGNVVDWHNQFDRQGITNKFYADVLEKVDDILPGNTDKIKVISDGLPLGMLIMRKDDNTGGRFLVFSLGSKTGKAGQKNRVWGIAGTDERLLEVLEQAADWLWDAAKRIEDSRSRDQRSRDRQLIKLFGDQGWLRRPYKISETDPLEIFQAEGVFPLVCSLETNCLIKALQLISTAAQNTNLPPIDVIDVGCGTGVLGFSARNLAEKVYLLDNNPKARTAVERNLERAFKDKDEGMKFYYKSSNLLDNLDSNILQNNERALLFIFNFPLYKSPYNLFNVGGNFAGIKQLGVLLDEIAVRGCDSRNILIITAQCDIAPETDLGNFIREKNLGLDYKSLHSETVNYGDEEPALTARVMAGAFFSPSGVWRPVLDKIAGMRRVVVSQKSRTASN
jgi:hypothetical protein